VRQVGYLQRLYRDAPSTEHQISILPLNSLTHSGIKHVDPNNTRLVNEILTH